MATEEWNMRQIYETARPFNPYRCCASDAMKEVVAEVLNQMGGYEEYYKIRERKRTKEVQIGYEGRVEAIVCDLVYRELEIAGGQVHVSQSNRVLRKASRYKGGALGKTLPDELRIMAAEEMGFVEITAGKRQYTIKNEFQTVTVSGKQTTLSAGRKILSRIERLNLTFADIGRSTEEEVIILRGPKVRDDKVGELVEYVDTKETINQRQQLQFINKWLGQADIECTIPNTDLYDRCLKRIFNNADFAQGGRLYGGFWQKLTHSERLENIILDDDSIAELDYGQMGLMLLYGVEGAVPPEGDLYDLSEYGIPTSCRPGIKKIIQAAINTSKPLGRMPQGARKTIPKKISLFRVLEAVGKRHPAIAHRLGASVGMQLMRKESDILVEVLLALKTKNITALPIHDAVLVNGNYAEEAKDIMIRVFKELVQLTPEVTIEQQ
jgi:hypothetical protein